MTFKNTLLEIKKHQQLILDLENQAIELLKATQQVGIQAVRLIDKGEIIGYNVGFVDSEGKIVDFVAFADTEREAWLEAVYCCDGISSFSIE